MQPDKFNWEPELFWARLGIDTVDQPELLKSLIRDSITSNKPVELFKAEAMACLVSSENFDAFVKEDQTHFRTQLITHKEQTPGSNRYYAALMGELIQLIDSISSLKEYIKWANTVHDYSFASAAPEVRFPNVYGIDMPGASKLIAHNKGERNKYIATDPIIEKLSKYHSETYLNGIGISSLLKLYYLSELISKKIDDSLTMNESANPSLYIEVEKYHALLAEIKCDDEFYDKFTEVPLTSDEEEDIADIPSAQRISNNETPTPDTPITKMSKIKTLYDTLNEFEQHTKKVRKEWNAGISLYVTTIKEKTRDALKLQFLSSSGYSDSKLNDIKTQIQDQTEIISKKIPPRYSQKLQNIATLAMSICTVGIVAIVATCYNLKYYNYCGIFRPRRSYGQTLVERTNQYAIKCLGGDNGPKLKA